MIRIAFSFFVFVQSLSCFSQTWNTVGGGIDINQNGVLALKSFNNVLYVGGEFGAVAGGTIPAIGLAKWNGTSWFAMGNLTVGTAECFSIHNNELYLGGGFIAINGNYYLRGVARWDSTQWQPLSKGVFGYVYAMASYDSNLFVGGQFTIVDSFLPAMRIARWDGTQWHAMGTGFTGGLTRVDAMTVYNNELIVAGEFGSIDGLPVNNICRWNGTSWDSLTSGTNSSVLSLLVDTINNLLYVGGHFDACGSVSTPTGIATWNCSNWAPVGTNPYIPAVDMHFYRGKLFVAATYETAVNSLGDTLGYITWFDGTNWLPVCHDIDATVFAFEIYNDELYAGGEQDYTCDSLVLCLGRYYEPPLSISEISERNLIKVIPNPARDFITIEGNELRSVSIYNVLGNICFERRDLFAHSEKLNVSNLNKGVYFLKVKTSKGNFNEKVIIQ